jgi:pimeloyl-ACP methyl ester carboxylesterase
MDAALLMPPRRMMVPIRNRWGAGEMAVMDFGDPKRPVDLVFVHGNGLNAATYRSLLAPLSSSLRIMAPDLRGHGLSRLPTQVQGRRGWGDYRDDLITLLESLEGPPIALAGHSMGGTSALLAAAARPSWVSRLVLLDPVILSRPMTVALGLPVLRYMARGTPMARAALRRRDRFDDRKQALDAYRGRGAFKGWPDMMLADYVSEGLVDANPGVSLACTPAWEASNFASQGHDPWAALKRIDRPVSVLKAEHGSTCSLSQDRPGVTVRTIPGGNHFFPMLKPDVARDALFDAAV